MKKLLIALLVAGVLGGAVYGAAANITINNANVGAGEALVNACDPTINISYGATWNGVSNQYEIQTVTLTHATPECDNAGYELRLTDVGGASLTQSNGNLDADGSTDVNVPDTAVSLVYDVALLVVGP